METIKIQIEIQDNGQTSMPKLNSDIQALLRSMAACKFSMSGQDKVMTYEKGNMGASK